MQSTFLGLGHGGQRVGGFEQQGWNRERVGVCLCLGFVPVCGERERERWARRDRESSSRSSSQCSRTSAQHTPEGARAYGLRRCQAKRGPTVFLFCLPRPPTGPAETESSYERAYRSHIILCTRGDVKPRERTETAG